jgi:hypothetical protein
MAQLSRPYQIALAALVLFAAVWFMALRGHAPSATSGSGSSAAVSAPAATAPASSGKASAPSSVYHGSAPGVQGLTRAIAKAQGAVATSQQNAKQLEQKSAQASSAAPTSTASTPSAPSTTSSAATVTSSTASKSAAAAHPSVKHTAVPSHAAAPVSGARGRPAMQVRAERELQQGNVVVLLFWNPAGADDVIVRRELQALLALHGRVARGTSSAKKFTVHEAPASRVASFGTITRGVQVYGTPTLLIINKRGVATTLTGFQDSYSIRQAIEEARNS